MVIPLTKKEKLILEYIRVYTELHGYSPSLYEIKDHFELNAVSTVHEHISNLKKKGYIAKEMSQARSLRVIDTVLSDQQFLEIPISLKLNNNSFLMEIAGEIQSVFYHRKQLDKTGKYLGIMVDCDLYEDCGIHKGDYVVLKEEEFYKTTDEILACINDKFYYLGKIVNSGKTKTFEKYDPFKTRINNFLPKARIIGLFRDFRVAGNNNHKK